MTPLFVSAGRWKRRGIRAADLHLGLLAVDAMVDADAMVEDSSGPQVSPWTARVLTLFPELFPGPLGASLSGQALVRGLWRLETLDIRAHASDKHATVDDAPFGGGPGMVMGPDVVDAAIAAGLSSSPVLPLVHLTPRGRPLDQAWVKEHAAGPGLVLLCGRYEGVDERVIEARRPMEVSLGDFVLAGGDVAAMVVIEACVRLLPGVIGEPAALNEESFEQGLLEYPQYTRPREWQGRGVPEVLLSGDHGRIGRWRREQAEQLTRERRPDLWARYHGEGGSGAQASLRDIGARPYVTASGKDDER